MNANERRQAPAAAAASNPPLTSTVLPSETELATRFWDRVRLFALRRLRDAAAAEDVAQEVIRRVLDALRSDRLRSPAALPGFVFQTAYHVVLHQHRGAGREIRALQRMHAAAVAAAPPDHLTHLITDERRQAVRAALARLNEEDRSLLVWLFQEQHDPVEVARRLAITPGALRVRKYRALKRLAGLLGGSNDP